MKIKTECLFIEVAEGAEMKKNADGNRVATGKKEHKAILYPSGQDSFHGVISALIPPEVLERTRALVMKKAEFILEQITVKGFTFYEYVGVSA